MPKNPLAGRRALLLLVLLVPALAQAQAPPLTLTSPFPEEFGDFGVSVSGVRDADGDGRGDLLVGAYHEDMGVLQDAGQAYLYSGATGALLRTLQSPNPELFGQFGISVSGVPDIDGDGRGDLLVGAHVERGGEAAAGRAHLYSGATGALLRTLQSPNPEPAGFFGGSVSGVPDADGDGRGDLLVGAVGEDGGAKRAGRAHLYSGATGALLRTLQSPDPEFAGDFGISVSGVRDADGDGRGDLLVGAYRENGGAADAGRAYVYSGATGTLLRTLQSPNPEIGGRFGWSVSGAADGDGRGDLLVGAHREDGGATNAGRAYLFPSGTGSGLAVTLTPEDPPVVLPEEGGSFRFTFAVENTGSAPQSFQAWTEATFPDGSLHLALGPVAVALGAGEAVTRVLVQRAGAGLPAGAYTYTGYVGSYPDGAVASDGFPGLKLGAALGRPGDGSGRPAGLAGASAWATLYAAGGVPVAAGDVWAPDAFVSSAVSPASSVSVSPNPFAVQTALQFALAEAGAVRLSVYDVLGREVAALVDGDLEAGAHAAVFDAAGLPDGTYLYRLHADGQVQTGRLTVRK